MSILFAWPSTAAAEREFLECVARGCESGCACYRNACASCLPVLVLADDILQRHGVDGGRTLAVWSVWRSAGRERLQKGLGELR